MQRFLQVDHDLAMVRKHQSDHTANPLVVDIDKGIVIDAVATGLNGAEDGFSAVHEFRVSHYNLEMLRIPQILVSSATLAASAVAGPVTMAVTLGVTGVTGVIGAGISGCGQQGALYLPTEPAAARRATLPETLRPGTPNAAPAASPASAPVPSAR